MRGAAGGLLVFGLFEVVNGDHGSGRAAGHHLANGGGAGGGIEGIVAEDEVEAGEGRVATVAAMAPGASNGWNGGCATGAGDFGGPCGVGFNTVEFGEMREDGPIEEERRTVKAAAEFRTRRMGVRF